MYLCLHNKKYVAMRVLIVNTSEKTGGAAVAANRLMEALNNNGVKAKMLVRDKDTDQITVVELKHNIFTKWHFLWERFVIFIHLHFSKDKLFQLDIANSGFDITKLREFKEADIIHLNWVNQGMLSISGIKHILESNKPVVWTMHDIWPAVSICHLALDCHRYETNCGNCPYLPGKSEHDLSYKIWNKKKKILKDNSILFVACSHWLENEANKSALLVGQKITSIPNPIDMRTFCKMDKAEARLSVGLPSDKRLILFVSQRATNMNKGINHLIEACRIMTDQNPDMKDNTAIAILGSHSEEFVNSLTLPVYPLGYVSDTKRIVRIYNSADIFVLPSLSENLPNTIMEAMSCGVPCIGFNVGGIPEEIDHKSNGYVAEYKNSEDLAKGISWILEEADYNKLSENAIKKVSANYSQHTIAMRYIEVYDEALAFKNYRL